MLPYHGNLPLITKLLDSIEDEGRSTCALLAPHYNLEMPGDALLYVVNNHTSRINGCVLYGKTEIVSISRRLVHCNMERGEIVCDTRPKTMKKGESFSHLVLLPLPVKP